MGGLRAGAVRELLVTDRYLDTDDGALTRAGWAARLRSDLTGDRISLKAREGGADGRPHSAEHRRAEVEGPADRDAPPAEWPTSPARDRLLALAGQASLGERFVVEQVRHERELNGPGGRALLSLDDVTFRRDGRKLGRSQVLEIELRSGGAGLLDGVAAALESEGGLTPEPRSKQELAEELISRADGVAQKAAAPKAAGPKDEAPKTTAPKETARKTAARRGPGIRPEDPVAEAGRKVLGLHLARMLEREEGAVAGDVDDVHRMRVATRRMRAAWRVFGTAYRRRDRKRHVDELRAIARRLGAVRDLDVLLEGLDRYKSSLDEAGQKALAPLGEAWSADRAKARVALRRSLGSKGYRRFVDDYRAFTLTPGAGGRPDGGGVARLVRDSVASAVWQAYGRVRGYEAVLAEADLETLHRLRIEGKRLRYTLESYRETLGDEADALIETVTTLQDELGALHDADVAAGLAREFLAADGAGLPSESTEAVAGYLADRESELARRRAELPKAWGPILAASFRRSLSGALNAD